MCFFLCLETFLLVDKITFVGLSTSKDAFGRKLNVVGTLEGVKNEYSQYFLNNLWGKNTNIF